MTAGSIVRTQRGRGPDDARRCRIDLVQVYAIAGAPADPRLGALDHDSLGAIAERARAAGPRAEVYN